MDLKMNNFIYHYMKTLQQFECTSFFNIEHCFTNYPEQIFQFSQFENYVLVAKVINVKKIRENISGVILFQIETQVQKKDGSYLKRDFYIESTKGSLQLENTYYVFLNFQVMINLEIDEIVEKDYLPFILKNEDNVIQLDSLTKRQQTMLNMIKNSFKCRQSFNYIQLSDIMTKNQLKVNYEKRQTIVQNVNQKIQNNYQNVLGVITEIQDKYIILNTIDSNQISNQFLKVYIEDLSEDNLELIEQLGNLSQEIEYEDSIEEEEQQKTEQTKIQQILQQYQVIIIQEINQKLTQNLDIIYIISRNSLVFNLGIAKNYQRLLNNILEVQPISFLFKLNDQMIIDRQLQVYQITLNQITQIIFTEENGQIISNAVLIVQDQSSIALLTLKNEDVFQFFGIQKFKELIKTLLNNMSQLNLKNFLHNQSFAEIACEHGKKLAELIHEVFYKLIERYIFAKTGYNQKFESKISDININGSFFEDNCNKYMTVPYLSINKIVMRNTAQQTKIYLDSYKKLNN